jgi:hypothetical protein
VDWGFPVTGETDSTAEGRVKEVVATRVEYILSVATTVCVPGPAPRGTRKPARKLPVASGEAVTTVSPAKVMVTPVRLPKPVPVAVTGVRGRPQEGLTVRLRLRMVKVALALKPPLSVAMTVLAPGMPATAAVPGTLPPAKKLPVESMLMTEVFRGTALKVRAPIAMVPLGVKLEPETVMLAPGTPLEGYMMRVPGVMVKLAEPPAGVVVTIREPMGRLGTVTLADQLPLASLRAPPTDTALVPKWMVVISVKLG